MVTRGPFPFSLQPEDIQQPGIRRVVVPVRVAGIRGGVPADENVHDPNVLCEGVGSRVPVSGGWGRLIEIEMLIWVPFQATNGDLHALLDRAASQWTAAVAGQGVDSNGQSEDALQFDVVRSAGRGRG